MAGHLVSTFLRETGCYEVATLSARHRAHEDTTLLDVLDRAAFEEYLDKRDFDVVVNCVGSLIHASERRKDLAVYLNSYLPHLLEHRYSASNTKIIHLSTDCVFSGENPPYREDSPPDGALFYDRSKYLGEIDNDKDLTFRMSIIGPDRQPDGVGLFNWFFAQNGDILGYTKAVWNGVTTTTLARAIDAAIEQDLVGVYHLVSQWSITKFKLLELMRDAFQRHDIAISPYANTPTDKTLVNTRIDFDFEVPSYEAQLLELRTWIETHASLYPHYARLSSEQA